MAHRIKILGKTWHYAKMPEKEYVVKHGPGSLAITDVNKKTIDFIDTECNLTNIVHELVHAYKTFLCLDTTVSINDEDYEEIYAEFFAKNGLSIIDNSLKMYSKLNKTANKKELDALIKVLRKVEETCL